MSSSLPVAPPPLVLTGLGPSLEEVSLRAFYFETVRETDTVLLAAVDMAAVCRRLEASMGSDTSPLESVESRTITVSLS
jgi:hypothetical protein